MARKKRNKKNNALIILLTILISGLCFGLVSLLSENSNIKDWVDSTIKKDDEDKDVSEVRVFGDIMDNVIVSSLSNFNMANVSFAYNSLSLFENSTITKIGIPVKSISDYSIDNKLSLYVVDSATLTTTQTYYSSHDLIIKANIYTNNIVNSWVYFEDLNIEVSKGQTLAFMSTTDTIIPGFSSSVISSGLGFFNKVLTSNACVNNTTCNLLFDIYKKAN